jgi:integrase/recombinase XerD
MPLAKQAKALTHSQQKAVLGFLQTLGNVSRNTVMFLLSVDAGLRAKEIANLEWEILTDAAGSITDQIRLQDWASKGRSGGVIYMSRRLRQALVSHAATVSQLRGRVVRSQRQNSPMSAHVVVNWFFDLYHRLGFEGCSSHSGRRTAITRWARNISSVGGSLRDVQSLARHASLTMTQRYVEINPAACKKVVG